MKLDPAVRYIFLFYRILKTIRYSIAKEILEKQKGCRYHLG